MKKLLLTIWCCLPLLVYGQNGIIGTGFTNGFNNPNDVIGFSASAGNSRIVTLNPNGTGNQFFRFVRFMNFDNTEFGPFGCVDTEWTGNEGVTYFNMPNCGSGAFFINCPNTTDNYVFKTTGSLENDFVYFRVQGDLRNVTAVTAPLADIGAGSDYEVTATTDDPLNAGQGIFLRYSTDNFASSTVLAMTEVSSLVATDYVATIPGQLAGTNVSYYVFTSGDLGGVDPANADWYTINLNNNGGSNYTYSVTAPLPVQLTTFEASRQRGGVLLEWTTASEQDNDYFAIERSADAQNWLTIGGVSGWGNTSVAQSYQFVDRGALSGNNYYRLRQVDFSGATEWSPVRLVEWRAAELLRYSPNPVSDWLSVRIDGVEVGWRLALYNTQGQVVQNHRGDAQQDLDLGALPSGLYWLQLRDAQGQLLQQERLVKQ
ncbi:MAG: T9SS type A sorting domain-containing protein [Bacteroidota bacterium]